MLAKRIIACLDVRSGRVVKGQQFRELRDAGSPQRCAARYCEQGVDEIVMLDVAATLEDRIACLSTVRAIAREIDVPLTVGGGVRSLDDIESLLEAGADKVSINSAAAENPQILSDAAARYGRQSIVLAIDARRSDGQVDVATHSATKAADRDVCAWATAGERFGAGELLLTAVERDGSNLGYDLELIT
ncbi:MAG: HisA/HisF-related TIM barrel protein, partial [Candidatus Eremiobacteraeota bacterium]|nr:HisA/HisF-related TIM barrel protein [Candidatus Eremiobacteraeota bacterium]